MGYGTIAVTRKIFREILRAPESASDTQLNAVPVDAVHAALLLPSAYRVEEVGRDFQRDCYLVLVESPDVPEVQEGTLLPEVLPTYQSGNGGDTRLVKIAIFQPQDARPWRTIAF